MPKSCTDRSRGAAPLVASALALALLVVVSCAPPPITLKKLGEACVADGDCGSKSCPSGFCTRACAGSADCPTGFICQTLQCIKVPAATCTSDADCPGASCKGGACVIACKQQSDCADGYDCGYAKPADAQSTVGTTCYKAAYPNPDKGGWGTSCTAVSMGPKDKLSMSQQCVATATSPCAAGFTCRYESQCDPGAYCTRACATDQDCPTTMFCGTDVRNARPADCELASDCAWLGPDYSCQPVAGTMTRRCTSTPRCIVRDVCAPCLTDASCAPGLVCATDVGGEKFCAKACKPAAPIDQPPGAPGPFSFDCPLPANNQQGVPTGVNFYSCVPKSPSETATVCRPSAGACHGRSALMAFAGKVGAQCSWCRPGYPADCAGGLCHEDEFSKERFCAAPCTVKIKKTPQGYGIIAGTDDCAMGSTCDPTDDPAACTAFPCTVTGFCYATNVDHAVTCYPNP